MPFYFADARVPELTGLTPEQRKIVRRRAFEALCGVQPSTRWLLRCHAIGPALGILLGIGISQFASDAYRLAILLLVLVISAGVGDFIVAHQINKRLRPYLARFIDEHRDEITRL